MAAAAPSLRIREACDFCTKRKRKCDGDGVNPCSNCIAKRQPECHYSVRRVTGRRPGSASRRASKEVGGKAVTETPPASGSRDDSDGSGGLLTEHRCAAKLPLKRAHFGPSPATGLIGLRENVYIADFFRTVGFVPFTSESFIRKVMVETMFRATQARDPSFHGYSAAFGSVEEGEEEEEEEEKEEEGKAGWRHRGDVPGLGPGAAIASAAGACILWSTVAVGGLMGTRPQSSVDRYAQLAREALSSCFEDMSVETARAFTVMALLQDVRGNEEHCSKFIGFAMSILKALPPEEIPTDLADAHMMFKAHDLFDGFYEQLSEEDLRDAMGAVLHQAEEPIPIRHAELCRWLLKTNVRLLACFSMDVQNAGSCGDLTEAEIQTACPAAEPESGSRSGSASGSNGNGSGDLPSNNPPQAPGAGAGLGRSAPRVSRRRSLSGTLAQPPPPGPISQKFAARVLQYVNLMMHVTQSPEVRGGVGELYFWMIMAYACLLRGQTAIAVDGFVRCTDIFLEHPGMGRISSWKHLVHVCLNCMFVSGNAVKYEQLRASHSSVVDEGVPWAPPFGEFRGMSSICGNIFCKSVDNVFMAAIAQRQVPSNLGKNTAATPEDNTTLYPPGISDSSIPVYAPTAVGESWGGELFDNHLQSEEVEGWHGKKWRAAEAAAAAGTAAPPAAAPLSGPPELGVVGAFGGKAGNEQRARGTEVRLGFGTGAGPAQSIAGTNFSSNNNNSVGPVPAGDVAVRMATPWAPERQGGNRFCDQYQGYWLSPLQLQSSVPSAQTSSPAPGPAGAGGLGLLHAPDSEGAEYPVLLDAAKDLLEGSVSEGFGEGNSEEDMFRFFGWNA